MSFNIPNIKLLCLLLLLLGCQKEENLTRFCGNAMTMEYHILIGSQLDRAKQEEAQNIIVECFEEVNQIYNKWNPSSELSKLNRLPANTKAPISGELSHLLKLTDQVHVLSEGRFDPTIEPLQKIWRRALIKGELPSSEALENLPIGWKKIHFKNGFFWKEHSDCALDLSGIAKGYAIDLILERLRDQMDLQNLFVEWGGEIRAVGQHPEGRPWTIFISRFGDTNVEKAIDTLPLQERAIATSGDYLQNWTVDHETYCHIIDPIQQKPLLIHDKAISSASVTAPSCALADGLATTAMIFSNIEEAKEWALKIQMAHPDIEFWLEKNEP